MGQGVSENRTVENKPESTVAVAGYHGGKVHLTIHAEERLYLFVMSPKVAANFGAKIADALASWQREAVRQPHGPSAE